MNTKLFIEFQKRRKTITRLAILLGALVGTIALLASQGITSTLVSVPLLWLSLTYRLIINLRLWRCPSRNGHLGELRLSMKTQGFAVIAASN